MEVKYQFPGTIDIALDSSDLHSMQHQGFTVDRDGFNGFDSKTWVHLDAFDPSVVVHINENDAAIEPGGDLHVYLRRGSLWRPVVVEQPSIQADEGLVEHYLGRTGMIIVRIGS